MTVNRLERLVAGAIGLMVLVAAVGAAPAAAQGGPGGPPPGSGASEPLVAVPSGDTEIGTLNSGDEIVRVIGAVGIGQQLSVSGLFETTKAGGSIGDIRVESVDGTLLWSNSGGVCLTQAACPRTFDSGALGGSIELATAPAVIRWRSQLYNFDYEVTWEVTGEAATFNEDPTLTTDHLRAYLDPVPVTEVEVSSEVLSGTVSSSIPEIKTVSFPLDAPLAPNERLVVSGGLWRAGRSAAVAISVRTDTGTGVASRSTTVRCTTTGCQNFELVVDGRYGAASSPAEIVVFASSGTTLFDLEARVVALGPDDGAVVNGVGDSPETSMEICSGERLVGASRQSVGSGDRVGHEVASRSASV